MQKKDTEDKTKNNQSDYFEQFKNKDEYETFKKFPVAYFCAEYALESGFPTYAGGLGILSGDYIREVAKQGFPLVAVGLRYQKGQSVPSRKDVKETVLQRVVDGNGQDIVVSVPIEHRNVVIKAWQWQEGNAKVYLLDTDVEENDLPDRGITKNLYDMDRDIRLKQEIILGIGGFRLLAVLGCHASVYHLNEGHSAFLALELVRHEMEHQQVNFKEACEYAKKHILFTNHTLALAGQEKFAPEKVAQFIEMCAKDICLDSNEIATLGLPASDTNIFSMTTFSFRLSSRANTVSAIHYDNAKLVWPDEKMDNVTNGIFIDRWDKMKGTSEENILVSHLENKKKLLTLVKEKTGEVWGENDLVFVWARRLVSYKQPLFLFSNIEKLVEILNNSPVPVRIIFAGPSVPGDHSFQEKLETIFAERLKGTAVFIPDYNIELSQILTAGSNVWLNTPIIGTEACGTSGMKAALNGALSLSTSDGWINEVNHEDVGWVTGDSNSNNDMLNLLQNEIIPTYAQHLENPNDSLWKKKMITARNLILEQFSTSRMLREYIEKLYIPIMAQKHNHRVE